MFLIILSNLIKRQVQMTTIKKITDENNQLVKETYQDIRDTRNTQYISNFWKYLAFDPSLLKEVWTEVKNLMTKETLIDKKMKEMIFLKKMKCN